jgi:putative transposase
MEDGSAVSILSPSGQRDAWSHPSILALSEKRYSAARERFLAVVPIIRMPDETREDHVARGRAVTDASERANVSARTVYRWIGSYGRYGFKGLIVRESLGGRGRKRTNTKAESILQDLTDREFLSKQRKSRAELYREFKSVCHEAGIEIVDKKGRKRCPISRRTVYRRLREIDDRVITERRLGSRAYAHQYALQGGEFRDKDHPLQTILIDHTKLDIILRDKPTGKTIGRPWLTIALDAYSRTVWAYHLSLKQPSADTVGLTILMGCMKKDGITKPLHLSEWPVHGIPFQIQTDNGKDFRSNLLERGCQAHEICLIRRPVKRPEYGAYVERFIGTLNTKLIHNLPGTTFSDVRSRKMGDYDPEKESLLTFEEFERLLIEFIVNEYHNSIHEGMNATPLQKWKSGLEKEGIVPREPENPERFHQDFLCFAEPDGKRLIERDGVHYRDFVYFASELNSLPRKENGIRKKYLVRFDPADMRFLYIYDDKKDRYYRLLLKERPPEPFTLRELEDGVRELRKQGYRDFEQDIVLDTIHRRREFLRSKAEENVKACRNVASLHIEHKTQKRLGIVSPELIREPESDCDEELSLDETSSKIIRSFEDKETATTGDEASEDASS